MTLEASFYSFILLTFQCTISVIRKLLPMDGKYYGGADNTAEAYSPLT